MRVSFDIDGLLICASGVKSENPRRGWMRWRGVEPLRDGAVRLMKSLQERQCEIWIYTTSHRSAGYIRRWLRTYGIRIDGVINGPLHERALNGTGLSKYPPAFGIDIHIDDSDGVADEGAAYGFPVVVIRPDTAGWDSVVIAAIDELIAGRK